MPRCMLLPAKMHAFAHQWHGFNSESDAVCRIQAMFEIKKQTLIPLRMHVR